MSTGLTSFISVASFASNQWSQKYWLFFECRPLTWLLGLGPWKKWLTSSILIKEMWHRFITEVMHSVRWTHLWSMALHWSGTPLDLTLTQTLSDFINKFYWELTSLEVDLILWEVTSWEIDLVGGDFMGNWSGGSWSHGHEPLFVHFSCVYQFFSFFLQ